MKKKQDLSSAMEDYLEAVFDIEKRNSVARVKDIADRLKVKRSSVSVMLQLLNEKGYVYYSPYSIVSLTHAGRTIAECIHNRHKVLKELFIKLFEIGEEDADKCACEMEHGMISPLYAGMAGLLAFIEKNKENFDALKKGINENKPTDSCEKKDCRECAGTDKKPLIISLNGLKKNETGIIYKIIEDEAIAKRFIEMGITDGQKVKISKVAPLGDPIEIEIRKYRLSLRRNEAESILVEKAE
jgi:DtxR family Mn-dependent transcriptional regulator